MIVEEVDHPDPSAGQGSCLMYVTTLRGNSESGTSAAVHLQCAPHPWSDSRPPFNGPTREFQCQLSVFRWAPTPNASRSKSQAGRSLMHSANQKGEQVWPKTKWSTAVIRLALLVLETRPIAYPRIDSPKARPDCGKSRTKADAVRADSSEHRDQLTECRKTLSTPHSSHIYLPDLAAILDFCGAQAGYFCACGPPDSSAVETTNFRTDFDEIPSQFVKFAEFGNLPPRFPNGGAGGKAFRISFAI